MWIFGVAIATLVAIWLLARREGQLAEEEARPVILTVLSDGPMTELEIVRDTRTHVIEGSILYRLEQLERRGYVTRNGTHWKLTFKGHVFLNTDYAPKSVRSDHRAS